MRETTTLDIANQKGTNPCPSQHRQQVTSLHYALLAAASRLSFLANKVTTAAKYWGSTIEYEYTNAQHSPSSGCATQS